MFSFLDYLNVTVICSGAAFAAGVIFSTKILDFIKGVPSEARAVLKSAESGIVAKLADAKAAVMVDIQNKLGVAPTPAKIAVAPAAQPTLTPAPAPAPVPASAPAPAPQTA